MARRTAAYLERRDLRARTVVLKLRYADFKTITRGDTRDPSTRSSEEIASRAVSLLRKTEAGRRPVRLLGVSVHGFHERTKKLADPVNGALDQLDLPVDESGP